MNLKDKLYTLEYFYLKQTHEVKSGIMHIKHFFKWTFLPKDYNARPIEEYLNLQENYVKQLEELLVRWELSYKGEN